MRYALEMAWFVFRRIRKFQSDPGVVGISTDVWQYREDGWSSAVGGMWGSVPVQEDAEV